MLSSLYMFHLPFPKAGAILPSVVALGRQGASCAAPTAFSESLRLGRTSKIIKSNLQLNSTHTLSCITKHHVCLFYEHFQGWWVTLPFPGSLFHCFTTSNQENFPNTWPELPLSKFESVSPHPQLPERRGQAPPCCDLFSGSCREQ